MRVITFTAVACVAACTSAPSDVTLSTGSLVGTWNGTMSNGVRERYTFRSDRTFDTGRVDIDGTYMPAVTGTFDVVGQQLAFDATITDDTGMTVRAKITGDAHLGPGGMCFGSFSSQDAQDVVGTWTTHATAQQVDSSGMPVGAAQDETETYVLAADGTYMHASPASDSGTWQRSGDQITLTQSGPGGGVLTLTLVDGEVLCNPVFKKS